MGVFLGLNTEAYDREYSDRELIRRILAYFRPHARRVAAVGLSILLSSGLSAAQPIVVSRGLDLLVVSQSLSVLVGMVGIILLVGVGNWLAAWARRRLLARVVSHVILTLRGDAFAASVNHDLSFFDEFQSGRIISRITSDTDEFQQVITLITDLMAQLLIILVLLVVLLDISVPLTLLILAFTPLVFLLALGFRRIARFVTRKGFRAIAEVNQAIQEAITGIGVAKNFRQEAAIYQRFSDVNRQSYAINLRRGFVLANIFPLLNGLAGLGAAALVYWGGLRAAEGAISIGAWYLFIVSVERFWFPLVSVSAFWSQFQAGLSASERLFALIDAEPTVRQVDHQPADDVQGEIDFVDVDFGYTEQEQVLAGFNLHVEPGESLALVGHTGAGKSSIARLIARFYEFQGGQIRIDGHDIRCFDLESYRRRLGIVSQSPFLFSGTVADNIRYARPDLTIAEIERAARAIGDGEWLDALPNGLDTDVGERGSHLSMGQRQLVALMRVLVQEPAIFVLDEATASIDPFTEAQIQQATDLILARSTSILIAHRLSTVRKVDRIVVLKAGRIIEQGSHSELVASGGHYAALYDTYFRHQSPDYRPPSLPQPALEKRGG